MTCRRGRSWPATPGASWDGCGDGVVRILTVTADLPFPPVGGARTRNHHLLRALAEEHDVVVAAFDFGGERGDAAFPVDVRPVAWKEPAAMRDADEDGWRRLGADEADPYSVAYYESAG